MKLVNETDVRDELDGMERTDEINQDLIKSMRESGLVSAVCLENSKVRIFGAFNGYVRVNRGFVVTENGLRPTEIDNEEGFFRAVRAAETRNFGMVPYSFETNTNHEVFSVIDNDSLFCLGIIFRIPEENGMIRTEEWA